MYNECVVKKIKDKYIGNAAFNPTELDDVPEDCLLSSLYFNSPVVIQCKTLSQQYYIGIDCLHPDEMAFKLTGPLSDKWVDVVVPFYNEGENVMKAHHLNKKLERLFNIKKYIYVDNGSSDDTGTYLNALSGKDKKIVIVKVQKNKGYGYGLKAGFSKAASEYILVNHADSQFDPYLFLYHHLDFLNGVNTIGSIFPVRLGRNVLDSLCSRVLRILLTFLFFIKIRDFNGQPKLLKREEVFDVMDKLPDDFCIDLHLYLYMPRENRYYLPILQYPRMVGVSSWNHGFRKRVVLAAKYIAYAFKQLFCKKKRVESSGIKGG